MLIHDINKPVFEFSATHPARQFLECFIDCRLNCVGKELDGIDQEWFSQTELQYMSFSSFAYEHLSFDIELDGWLKNSISITESERRSLLAIPRIQKLMLECQTAALDEKNTAIVSMCDQVMTMSQLWKHCIEARCRTF